MALFELLFRYSAVGMICHLEIFQRHRVFTELVFVLIN